MFMMHDLASKESIAAPFFQIRDIEAYSTG